MALVKRELGSKRRCMITIKNKNAIAKMAQAGQILAALFTLLESHLKAGMTTADLDAFIDSYLTKSGMVSQTKGYKGYRHASCISVNEAVVHGVPSTDIVVKDGDLVKIDVCASWQGYCADMARSFIIGVGTDRMQQLVAVGKRALDKGIEKAVVGARLSDISAAIQQEIEAHGFGVVRDFAGHGIGKRMHEDPEILNYGQPGRGPVLQHGMTFAIEPMLTMGDYDVYVEDDSWTVKTTDGSLAVHCEDTIVILNEGTRVLTRPEPPVHNDESVLT